MYLNETDIQRMMIGRGKTAPSVTPEHIDSCIVGVSYQRIPDSLITCCVMALYNGHVICGVNMGPVSPENFDPEIGEREAYKAAREQIWPLEGYLLQMKLHLDAGGAGPGDVPAGDDFPVGNGIPAGYRAGAAHILAKLDPAKSAELAQELEIELSEGMIVADSWDRGTDERSTGPGPLTPEASFAVDRAVVNANDTAGYGEQDPGDAQGTDQSTILLGSDKLPSLIRLPSGETLTAGHVVRVVHAKSGLSTKAWNELPTEERDRLLQKHVDDQTEASVGNSVDENQRDSIPSSGLIGGSTVSAPVNPSPDAGPIPAGTYGTQSASGALNPHPGTLSGVTEDVAAPHGRHPDGEPIAADEVGQHVGPSAEADAEQADRNDAGTEGGAATAPVADKVLDHEPTGTAVGDAMTEAAKADAADAGAKADSKPAKAKPKSGNKS